MVDFLRDQSCGENIQQDIIGEDGDIDLTYTAKGQGMIVSSNVYRVLDYGVAPKATLKQAGGRYREANYGSV